MIVKIIYNIYMTNLTTIKNTGRFQKGMTPWNKGIEYLQIKGEKHPMFGKHHSSESIAKMKESLKGKIPWNKNKTGIYSEETKIKMGMANIGKSPVNKGEKFPGIGGRPEGGIPWNKGKTGLSIGFPKGKHNTKISGANHYCWKGGISTTERIVRNSLEMRAVIGDSKERDNYTCQMPGCGIRGGTLNSHHIKSFREYPNLRFDISNLITLCVDCHNLTKGGKEKMYEELFINIIRLKNNGD